MQTELPLTKKQTRNLNRRFELGVYRKKTIADYPLLHTFLANLLGGAHDQLLLGISVKLTLGQSWILDKPHTHDNVNLEFWLERLGSYRISHCSLYSYYVHLSVCLTDKKDIFYPDDFVLLIQLGTCQIDVSIKGKIEYIDLVLNSKPPRFIRDLARDFPLGGPCARRKLRQTIKCIGEEPDETFLAPIQFRRAITIQL